MNRMPSLLVSAKPIAAATMALVALVWPAATGTAAPPPAYLQVYGGPTFVSDAGHYVLASVGGVNNAGTAVGTTLLYESSSGGSALRASRPVRWDGSGTLATELDIFSPEPSGFVYCCNVAAAINDAGTTVGEALKFDSSGNVAPRPVRWDASGTAITELDVLGPAGSGYAIDINASGTALGVATKEDANGRNLGTRAVRWDASGTAATELGHLGTDGTGYSYSNPAAINAAGTAVGTSAAYDSSYHWLGERAVRWDASGTAATELGHLGTDALGITYTQATAINAAGTAIGSAAVYDGSGNLRYYAAVRWDAAGTAATELGNLGLSTELLGPCCNVVTAINDAGTIVGSAQKFDSSGNYLGDRAVRWNATGTAATELGILGADPIGLSTSAATDINSAGTAVGSESKYDDLGEFVGARAVYWRTDGVPVDLNTLVDSDAGWQLISADSISDTGWIAGTGEFDPDGPGGQDPYNRLFLIHVPATAVPETAALTLLSIASLCWFGRLRRPMRVNAWEASGHQTNKCQIVGGRMLMIVLPICVAVTDGAVAVPPRYHVTDLGTLGGEYSVALGINAGGQVTGHSQTTANATTNAFLWTPTTPNGTSGMIHDLGRLGGQISVGNGINAGGQVAGWSNTNGEPGGAFLWTPTTPGGASGSMLNLGTLGGSYSEARGINTSGQVVGYSNLAGDTADRAFLWTPTMPAGDSGTMHDLGTLGGRFSVGNDVNDRGQVTGVSSRTGDRKAHAFLWTPNTPGGTTGMMVDLGTLGGPDSEAVAINASGQVIGQSLTDDFVLHAFLWTPTTPGGASGMMLDLQTLGGESSQGYGINASGQVVGYSQVIVGDVVRQHAFLYTSERGMVDLNTLVDPLYVDPLLGWEIQVAWAINDFGQIAAGGYVRGGLHTFLLTPVPVPEPTSAILVALAALGLAVTLGRRTCGRALANRALLAATILLLVSVVPASAGTLSASTVAELIAAIDAANQNAGPDSIVLAEGATFTLTEVNNTTSGFTGLPTITASENLTIVGNGAIIERSTATETPAFRILSVAAGASLALENLTLQGGLGSALGGAIYNEGNLALDGVTVQNNIAQGWRGVDCRCRPGGNGGNGGSGWGGGIYSDGSLLLQNSVLLSNQARGGQGGFGSPPGRQGGGGWAGGGGLYVAAGSATLYNSLVTGNSAVGGFGSPPGGGLGGGIFIASALVGLDERTLADVTNNTASTNYPDIYGPYNLIPNSSPLPGDYNEDGTVNAADYTVWRDNFGGTSLANRGPGITGPVDQRDYDFWKANFGDSIGAGSSAALPSAALLSPAVPEPANLGLLTLAALGTVALSARRRLTAALCFITVSIGPLEIAAPARAAMFDASTVAELITAIDAANQNTEPDSIALAVGATYTLMDRDNSMNGWNGLPQIVAGEDLTIIGNGATIERSTGGDNFVFRLFHVAAEASLSLEDVTLQGGQTIGVGAPGQGGAIFNLGTLSLQNVVVRNNGAYTSGGGIYSNGSLTVEGGVFEDNEVLGVRGRDATSSPRGGVRAATRGGDGLGGGLYVAGGTALLADVSLVGNTAQGGRGGDGTPGVGNGGLGAGGGLYVASGDVQLRGVTLFTNSASGGNRGNGNGGTGGNGNGGGLYAGGGSISAFDSSATENSAQGGNGGQGTGGGLFIDVDSIVSLNDFTASHVTNNAATTSDPNISGTYEIISDPNPLSGDYSGDGAVGPDDYDLWKANFGSTTFSDADGNGDGIVNAADYTIWRDHLGQSLSAGAGSGASLPSVTPLSPAVPEPATFALAALGLVGLATAIKRWRTRVNRPATPACETCTPPLNRTNVP